MRVISQGRLPDGQRSTVDTQGSHMRESSSTAGGTSDHQTGVLHPRGVPGGVQYPPCSLVSRSCAGLRGDHGAKITSSCSLRCFCLASRRRQDTTLSVDIAAADVKVLGSYRMVEASFGLVFPEPNSNLMRHRQTTLLHITTPTRFIERRSRWSGKGIQNPPRIRATIGDTVLDTRRHGSHYTEESWRAYLVDLGKTVDAGTLVSLTTAVQYVDESGKFERFFAYKSYPGLMKLELWVSFLNPPPKCAYNFKDAEAEEWAGEPTLLTADQRDDLTDFRVQREEPPPGLHRLSW